MIFKFVGPTLETTLRIKRRGERRRESTSGTGKWKDWGGQKEWEVEGRKERGRKKKNRYIPLPPAAVTLRSWNPDTAWPTNARMNDEEKEYPAARVSSSCQSSLSSVSFAEKDTNCEMNKSLERRMFPHLREFSSNKVLRGGLTVWEKCRGEKVLLSS